MSPDIAAEKEKSWECRLAARRWQCLEEYHACECFKEAEL